MRLQFLLLRRLLSDLADLFRPTPVCCCNLNDPDEPCGACPTREEAFEASKIRTGPLLRCRLSDLLPSTPRDFSTRPPS